MAEHNFWHQTNLSTGLTVYSLIAAAAGCALPGFPGVYVRLDTFADFISSHGYCGCTSTGLSGAVNTSAAGCSAGVLQEEQQAGAGLESASGSSSSNSSSACYIVDPERCGRAAPSKLFPGAALAPCNSSTNLTLLAAEGGGVSSGGTGIHRAAGQRGATACPSVCRYP